MNTRALIAAVLTALVGAGLLFLYLRNFEEQASGGAPVALLVAIKPIEPGMLLTDDMLSIRKVPQAYVENRAVRDTERQRVLGLRVSTGVQAQQLLMWTDLAITPDDRRDLSSLVQPGMRAVGIRAANDDKSFALIRPGDRVDVISTFPAGQGESRSSIVLLQNVLVLAVGLDTGSDTATRRNANEPRDLILTLSLNVPEAQLLSLAIEKGRISVALRNPDDVRTTEGLSDMNSSTLTNTEQRRQVQLVRQTGPIRLNSAPPGPPQ